MVIRFHCGLICTGGFVLFEDERRRKETNNKNDEKGMYQKKKIMKIKHVGYSRIQGSV